MKKWGILHLDKMLYLYRYRDANGNATYQRFQSIQDNLALARNHYAAQFERANAIMLESAQAFWLPQAEASEPPSIEQAVPVVAPVETAIPGGDHRAPSRNTGISFIVLDATGSRNAVDCLKSLKKYAEVHKGVIWRDPPEIILVENGCESQARSLADVVVTSLTNLGFAAGCNLGASKATESHLCFINDDAELVDEATIRNLWEAIRNNPPGDSWAGRHMPWTDDVIGGVYSDNAKPPQGNWTLETAPNVSGEDHQYVPMVVGLCMILSKRLFDFLGGFDPRFLTWEDDDLCTRARNTPLPWLNRKWSFRGAECIIVRGTFVHHKGHKTFESLKLDHVAVEDKNQRLFEQKHPKLKVIAIAKNEENCITNFYKQFEGITRDWYLLDTGSTDKTVELAQSIGVQVVSEPFVDFATMRNRALELFDPSQDSWVIQLDPDERLDKQTIEAIPELIFSTRAPEASFGTYLAPLTAVYPDGSRKDFVPKWFLAKNSPEAHWTCKVHEKWVAAHPYALVTNALIEHRIEFHTVKHRDGAEGLYSRLMYEEPYFQNPEYKAKMREEFPILDYDRLDDPRIAKIQAGPLVSVVIPTYKRTDLLRKAVQSALNQSYKNLEVIIVGDHCPELGSAGFGENPYSEEPRVRVINLTENHGAGGAEPRNVAINLAAGPYIAYLDDDNTWAPDHVSNLLTTILREQTVWGWSSMMVNGVDMKFDRLERGKIDTSCVIHHKSLIQKHGGWKQRSNEGLFHAEGCPNAP